MGWPGYIYKDMSGEPTEFDDLLIGSDYIDTIHALSGNDTVQGLHGDDRLFGGSGNDLLDGGSGNDN